MPDTGEQVMPLVAGEAVSEAGFFGRIWIGLKQLVRDGVTCRKAFISLEGGEGVGKSTQLKALHAALGERGIEVIETREPGGSEGAEAIRALLLTRRRGPLVAEAEALLFAAARTDHVDKTIRPAIWIGAMGAVRSFSRQSLAYQGGAGGLGMEAVRAINAFGMRGFFPTVHWSWRLPRAELAPALGTTRKATGSAGGPPSITRKSTSRFGRLRRRSLSECASSMLRERARKSRSGCSTTFADLLPMIFGQDKAVEHS